MVSPLPRRPHSFSLPFSKKARHDRASNFCRVPNNSLALKPMLETPAEKLMHVSASVQK